MFPAFLRSFRSELVFFFLQRLVDEMITGDQFNCVFVCVLNEV